MLDAIHDCNGDRLLLSQWAPALLQRGGLSHKPAKVSLLGNNQSTALSTGMSYGLEGNGLVIRQPLIPVEEALFSRQLDTAQRFCMHGSDTHKHSLCKNSDLANKIKKHLHLVIGQGRCICTCKGWLNGIKAHT